MTRVENTKLWRELLSCLYKIRYIFSRSTGTAALVLIRLFGTIFHLSSRRAFLDELSMLLGMKRVVIVVLFLGGTISSAAQPQWIFHNRVIPPTDDLEETIRITQELIRDNAPRSEVARWVTQIVDYRITNMNTPERLLDWRNLNPFDPNKGQREFDKWRDQVEFSHEPSAKWAWEHQMGNCEENANLAYYILKRAGVPGTLRLMYAGDSHVFPVWGIRRGANPADPYTWGSEWIVVDPWWGGTITDPEVIAEDRWFGNDGEENIQDGTQNHDKESEAWTIAPENAPDSSDEKSGCFVATAVSGSPFASDVIALQSYREQFLRRSSHGLRFIAWYEKWGPIFADWLHDHPNWKPPVREFIVHPAADYARRKLEEMQ